MKPLMAVGMAGALMLLAPASASMAAARKVPVPEASAGALDRTVLPIPEPMHTPIKELDARKVKAPPPFAVKPPEGAPNVVIVLIDDMGFGTAGTFGGPVAMPTLDRLAHGGCGTTTSTTRRCAHSPARP